MTAQEHLAALQRAYRSYRLSVFCFIPLLIAAAVFLFWNRYVTLVLLELAVLYQLFYLRRRQRRYTSQFNRANLQVTLCPALGCGAPEEQGSAGITRQTILEACLMPLDKGENAALLRQGLQGKKEDVAAALCDAVLAESFTLVNKGRHRVHFNCGCWIHLTLPLDTGCDWRLLQENALPTLISRAFYAGHTELEAAPLADRELAGRFVLYRPVTQPEQAPSPALLKQLRLLADYTPGQLAISLRGRSMDVFLRNRFLARPVSFAAAPTLAQLELDPLPELDYLLRMAKTACRNREA